MGFVSGFAMSRHRLSLLFSRVFLRFSESDRSDFTFLRNDAHGDIAEWHERLSLFQHIEIKFWLFHATRVFARARARHFFGFRADIASGPRGPIPRKARGKTLERRRANRDVHCRGLIIIFRANSRREGLFDRKKESLRRLFLQKIRSMLKESLFKIITYRKIDFTL